MRSTQNSKKNKKRFALPPVMIPSLVANILSVPSVVGGGVTGQDALNLLARVQWKGGKREDALPPLPNSGWLKSAPAKMVQHRLTRTVLNGEANLPF